MSRSISPDVQSALATLAATSDDIVGGLGCWRHPDGSIGDFCTREDWRRGLLDGSVDPHALTGSIRLHQALMAMPPELFRRPDGGVA